MNVEKTDYGYVSVSSITDRMVQDGRGYLNRARRGRFSILNNGSNGARVVII